jgi:hypothetical protein
MADLSKVKEHMEIVAPDGGHVGTVDKVEGDRIKLTKREGSAQGNHHRYVSASSVAAVEGNRVRLTSGATIQ